MNSRELAARVRADAVRMVHEHGAAHIGAALSIADILAVLYSDVMRVDPNKPDDPMRDRFILSKGHAGVAVYATLARCGFFPVSDLDGYYTDGGYLSGHVSSKNVKGVDFSTGSLGHGAAVAAGMALAAKIRRQDYRVFTIVGDGECDEGSIWELAMFAPQQKLDNFCLIVDRNGMQAMGRCEDALDLGDMAAKWRAFGWEVFDTDGHDHDALRKALSTRTAGKPVCVVAHTVKGKGVSFMENDIVWHYDTPKGELYEQAMKELEASYA